MTAREVSLLASLVKHVKDDTDPLTPLIDTYLAKRKTSPERLQEWTVPIPERARPGGRLSPSSICGCRRQAILKFVGYEPPRKYIDVDKELIFEDGNWRHHKWDALFADMEIVLGRDVFRMIEYERQVQVPKLFVAGSLDVTIWIKGTGKIVVDFKGANEYAFSYAHREHKPPEEYVRQLMTYMVARKVKRGMLLFDNKNNQQFKVFTYEFDQETWGEVKRWCERTISDLEQERLPGRHTGCNNGSFLFERCPFSGFCFGPNRDNPEKLRRLAYKDFEGVEEAWRAGLKALN